MSDLPKFSMPTSYWGRTARARPHPVWRSIDSALAIVGLIYFSPLLLLAAAVLWLGGIRPVLRSAVPGQPYFTRFGLISLSRPGSAPEAGHMSGVCRWLWCCRLDRLPGLVDVIAGRAGLLNPHLPGLFSRR